MAGGYNQDDFGIFMQGVNAYIKRLDLEYENRISAGRIESSQGLFGYFGFSTKQKAEALAAIKEIVAWSNEPENLKSKLKELKANKPELLPACKDGRLGELFKALEDCAENGPPAAKTHSGPARPGRR